MPAWASVPSPTTSSTICRSCGGDPSGKSISGRWRCGWDVTDPPGIGKGIGREISRESARAVGTHLIRSGGTRASAGVQQVDDEDEGVGALDAERLVAGRAVAVVRRHDDEQPAADGPADERPIEPGDDLATAYGERGGAATPPRRVELATARPDDADVVRLHLLQPLHGRTPALHERLNDELGRRRALRERDGRASGGVGPHRREPRARRDDGAGGPGQ